MQAASIVKHTTLRIFVKCVIPDQTCIGASDVIWVMATTVLTLAFTITYATGSVIKPTTDDNVKNYFDSLVSKPTPLWFCRGWIEGIKWRIPKPIHCPLMPVNAPSRVVDITVWWEDISMNTLDGYDCYGVKSVRVVTYYFFGAKTYDSWTEKYPVSEKECRTMMIEKKSPDGEKLEHIRDGYFATGHVPRPQQSWCREVREEVINYFVISLKFFVSNKDDTVETTTKLNESCHYSRGFCTSELGVVVWNIKGINQCRIRKGANTSCVLTGRRLSCPELTMSTNSIRNVAVCSHIMGTGDTGLLFTQDINGSIDDTIITTAALEQFQNSGERKKRSKATGLTKPKFSSDKELNSTFQYLYDLVAGNVSYALQQFHIDICKTNKVMLDMMRSLASGGNPTTLVRALLGEPSYKARLDGDVVSIWKCAAVYDYMFTSSEKCTVEYPVKYVDNHETRSGWVTPISHEIVDLPTEVPCPGTDFYFETENMVILLANKSVVTNLPILPTPQRDSNIESHRMPDLSFVSPGAYSAEDISGQETILGVIRQLQSKLVLDNAVRSMMNGKGFDAEQLAALDALSGIIVNPLYHAILKLIAFVVPAISLAVTITYRRQLRKILNKVIVTTRSMLTPDKSSKMSEDSPNTKNSLQDLNVNHPPRHRLPASRRENSKHEIITVSDPLSTTTYQGRSSGIYPTCPTTIEFESSDED